MKSRRCFAVLQVDAKKVPMQARRSKKESPFLGGGIREWRKKKTSDDQAPRICKRESRHASCVAHYKSNLSGRQQSCVFKRHENRDRCEGGSGKEKKMARRSTHAYKREDKRLVEVGRETLARSEKGRERTRKKGRKERYKYRQNPSRLAFSFALSTSPSPRR
jgi:hypothetical protein